MVLVAKELPKGTDIEILMNRTLVVLESQGVLPPSIDKLPELTFIEKLLEKIGIKIRRYHYEYDAVNEWEKE